jgi:hypothetical protein
LHRGLDERVALTVGQHRDRGQGGAHEQPALDLLLQAVRGDQILGELVLDRCAPGCLQRCVADDLVEPTADVLHLGARSERGERAHQSLLNDVLRIALRSEAARKPHELTFVARGNGDKRPVMPRTREADQTLVRL